MFSINLVKARGLLPIKFTLAPSSSSTEITISLCEKIASLTGTEEFVPSRQLKILY